MGVALSITTQAQSICFDSGSTSYSAGYGASDVRLVDVNGDSTADLVTINFFELSWYPGLGDGTFGQAVTIPFAAPASTYAYVFVDFDLEGDGDADLAVGFGSQSNYIAVFVNDGLGTFTQTATYATSGTPRDLAKADLDHDGDVDLVAAIREGHSVDVLLNLGGGAFAPLVDYYVGFQWWPISVDLADMTGDGYEDIVLGTLAVPGGGQSGFVAVLVNNGIGGFAFSASGDAAAGALDCATGDIDGDGDRDIVASRESSLFVRVYRNTGSGQIPAPYTDIPVGSVPAGVALFDADADGDLDLFVTAAAGTRLYENDGSGSFSLHDTFSPAGPTERIAVRDVNGDGHPDLVWTELQTGSARVRLNCGTNGIPFCFGDGSGTACPCGNASAVGAQAGCLHSFGTAGKLVSTGTPSVAADTVTLVGTGMTNAPALYFQAISYVNGAAGASFGDGLRCTGGTTIRLGTKINAGGASQYPAAGDPAVSVKGAVPVGATRLYQVLYRNNASFCTSATFNLSNGLRITWSP